MRFSIAAPCALALLLLCASRAAADLDEADLDDSFSLRQGDESKCPGKLEIDTRGDKLEVTAGELQLDEKDCEGDGVLQLVMDPSSSTQPGVAYLMDEARRGDVGDVAAGTVSEDLKCGTFTLRRGTEFSIVKPRNDVEITWADMFGASSPLASDGDKTQKLGDGNTYVFYGDGECFYSETGITDRVCFPAAAHATLRDGKQVRLDKLRVGDDVLVAPHTFSPVIGWTHRDASRMYKFVRLETQSGHALVATHGHFVRAAGALRPMRSVRVGMELTLGDGATSRVVAKSTVRDTGLYNPQTMHGDIVVDGVVASTYTSAVPPAAAHALLAPVRAAYCVAGRLGSALFMSWA